MRGLSRRRRRSQRLRSHRLSNENESGARSCACGVPRRAVGLNGRVVGADACLASLQSATVRALGAKVTRRAAAAVELQLGGQFAHRSRRTDDQLRRPSPLAPSEHKDVWSFRQGRSGAGGLAQDERGCAHVIILHKIACTCFGPSADPPPRDHRTAVRTSTRTIKWNVTAHHRPTETPPVGGGASALAHNDSVHALRACGIDASDADAPLTHLDQPISTSHCSTVASLSGTCHLRSNTSRHSLEAVAARCGSRGVRQMLAEDLHRSWEVVVRACVSPPLAWISLRDSVVRRAPGRGRPPQHLKWPPACGYVGAG